MAEKDITIIRKVLDFLVKEQVLLVSNETVCDYLFYLPRIDKYCIYNTNFGFLDVLSIEITSNRIVIVLKKETK